MRFWFEHSGEVSLREQVVTQVTLGILCGELTPGERLPSIRELARRFGLHANTVSAGYRQLEAEGWVDSRRGSGVYVRDGRPRGAKGAGGLERLVETLFAGAQRLGVPRAEVVAQVSAWAAAEAPTLVVLVEPDEALRHIVLAELGPEVQGCGEVPAKVGGMLLLALPSKVERVKAEARGKARVLGLRVRAVTGSMTAYLPKDMTVPADALIGVVSAWSEFRRFARTMLVASGFSSEALLLRDTDQAGWRQGLEMATAIVCDARVEGELRDRKVIVIRVLAEGVAEEVAGYLLAAKENPATRELIAGGRVL